MYNKKFSLKSSTVNVNVTFFLSVKSQEILDEQRRNNDNNKKKN